MQVNNNKISGNPLPAKMGEGHFRLLNSYDTYCSLIGSWLANVWIQNYIYVVCYVFRLWRSMWCQVSVILEAESVQEGMWNLLCPLQLCSSGHLRQPWCLPLLRQHDHSWQQTQVSLKYKSAVLAVMPVFTSFHLKEKNNKGCSK